MDQAARIPEGWLEHEPEMIPDNTKKPSTWNDDEDGPWEAPLMVNPKCKVGCGKWIPPLIKNPAYKGKWQPPLIDNPAYRGPWKSRAILNPDHYIEKHPAQLLPVTGIGFEVFTGAIGDLV